MHILVLRVPAFAWDIRIRYHFVHWRALQSKSGLSWLPEQRDSVRRQLPNVGLAIRRVAQVVFDWLQSRLVSAEDASCLGKDGPPRWIVCVPLGLKIYFVPLFLIVYQVSRSLLWHVVKPSVRLVFCTFWDEDFFVRRLVRHGYSNLLHS